MANSDIIIKYNNYAVIAAKAKAGVSTIVRKTGEDMVAIMQESMSGPKGGRMYGAHQASAPGEAPAIDLSNLVNSLRMEMEPGATEAEVVAGGTGVDYAGDLEFGTVKMAARPFATPAAEQVRPSFEAAMRQLEDRIK